MAILLSEWMLNKFRVQDGMNETISSTVNVIIVVEHKQD